MEIDVASAIKEILERRKAVNIAGLGSIMIENHPARISEDGKSIMPPSAALKYYDTFTENKPLRRYLSRKYGLSKSKAHKAINKFNASLMNALANYGEVNIKGVANIKNQKSKIKVTAHKELLDKYYKGLPVIKLKAKLKDKKKEASAQKIDKAQSDKDTTQKGTTQKDIAQKDTTQKDIAQEGIGQKNSSKKKSKDKSPNKKSDKVKAKKGNGKKDPKTNPELDDIGEKVSKKKPKKKSKSKEKIDVLKVSNSEAIVSEDTTIKNTPATEVSSLKGAAISGIAAAAALGGKDKEKVATVAAEVKSVVQTKQEIKKSTADVDSKIKADIKSSRKDQSEDQSKDQSVKGAALSGIAAAAALGGKAKDKVAKVAEEVKSVVQAKQGIKKSTADVDSKTKADIKTHEKAHSKDQSVKGAALSGIAVAAALGGKAKDKVTAKTPEIPKIAKKVITQTKTVETTIITPPKAPPTTQAPPSPTPSAKTTATPLPNPKSGLIEKIKSETQSPKAPATTSTAPQSKVLNTKPTPPKSQISEPVKPKTKSPSTKKVPLPSQTDNPGLNINDLFAKETNKTSITKTSPLSNSKATNSTNNATATSNEANAKSSQTKNVDPPKLMTFDDDSKTTPPPYVEEQGGCLKYIFWILGIGLLIFMLSYLGCKYLGNDKATTTNATTINNDSSTKDESTSQDSIAMASEEDATLGLLKADGTRECIIIVQVYSKAGNVKNLSDRLSKNGYTVYTEDYGPLTRVGFTFDCNNVDLEDYIRKERQRTKSPKAWYLQPEITVSY